MPHVLRQFRRLCTKRLADAIRRHGRQCGQPGRLDVQRVLALLLLNLAAGDCVDDSDRLEADVGHCALMRHTTKAG